MSEDDDADELAGDGPRRWSLASVSPVGLSLAAVILATASLLGLGSAQQLASFLMFDSGGADFKRQAVGPGVDAGVALLGLGLAIALLRRADRVAGSWAGVSQAAVVVATISLVVNLAAVGAALNGPDTPDIGSVFPSSPSSDLPTAPSDFFPSPVP